MSHSKSRSARTVHGFRKRVFTFRAFMRDLGFIAANAPEYLAVVRGRRVSVAFAEKLRLVTSAINQCVLCARLHIEWAALAGVDGGEIHELLRNEVGGATVLESELTALLYAQQYAQHAGVVQPAARRAVIERYGENTARDIELILRLINFFNLSLNTVEAFMSRISGRGVAQGSSASFELFVTLLALPIAGPLFAYTHIHGNRFTFDSATAEAKRQASASDARFEV